MELSDQLLGAVIGAGAAVITQLISAVLQFINQGRLISVGKAQIEIAAIQQLEQRRIHAIEVVRDSLQCLSDKEETAKVIYTKIRPYWIYLKDETEVVVKEAIRENISKEVDVQTSVESKMSIALHKLKLEISPSRAI